MLIKTFKFLSKEHTVNTGSFQSFNPKQYFPSTKKEAKELIDDYYVKYDEKTGEKLRHTGGDDHVLFPLSFSNLGNRIVQRYIDVMIQKYEIPREEWEDRIKVNILSTSDNNGNNYIIYVCAFCGLSYKAGISAKEWMDASIAESDISDEASTVKYNVSGDISIVAPSGVAISSSMGENASIKIKIESRDRYSVLRNTYIYDYKINDDSHRFYKLYLEKDYGKPDTKPVVVTVPRRGKLFLSVDDEDMKRLFPDAVDDLIYSVKRITGITKEKYNNKIITYEDTDYLDLGMAYIRPGEGSTIFTGTLYVYSQDRILDETAEPLNDIIVYIRTFRIDDYGFREYNPEEQDPQNPVSYQVKANETFSIEINHGFPYIEFSFKDGEDWWGEDVNNRPVDSYFYLHKLTEQEQLLQVVERDVNMYIINTSKYKLNIFIPNATSPMLESNSIMTDIICYYDSDEEPMFKKRIKLSRTSEIDEYPYYMITQELPIYSRVCVKTADESYTSMYYNVGFTSELESDEGVVTTKYLNKGQTNNIAIYPITTYNVGVQKFYAGSSRLTYIDIYNHEKTLTMENQFPGDSLNNMLADNRGLPSETTEVFKFVFPEDKILPMPGTPLFVNTLNGNDNRDSNYEISRNDYKRSYIINGKSYIGHFVIENNRNDNLSELTYKPDTQNYYISFNDIVNSDYDSRRPIDKNIRVFGIYAIREETYGETIITALTEGMQGKESAIAYIPDLIPPCARADRFPSDVDKHTANYTLYNVKYYLDIILNQGDISVVKRFLHTITGEDYSNRSIDQSDVINICHSDLFIFYIPYDNPLYIKYPHTELLESDTNIGSFEVHCRHTEGQATVDFSIQMLKKYVDNNQINLKSVVL